jgi:hydrogenase small subunit
MGTCASFGGIPASGGNPTGIKSVSAYTGKRTINISGCPPHPDWMVWPIVQLMLGNPIATDSNGRPRAIYDKIIHSVCPNRNTTRATTFGQLNHCLRSLGCRGPATTAQCPSLKWNNGVNWCIGAGSPCLGCTEPTFPGTQPFKTLW